MAINSAWYKPDALDRYAAPTGKQMARMQESYLRWLAGVRGIELPSRTHFDERGAYLIEGNRVHVLVDMPGYGDKAMVEVETLDENGDIERFMTLPLKANGALPWNANKVRQVVGLLNDQPKTRAKSRKAEATQPCPAEPAGAGAGEADATCVHVVAEPAARAPMRYGVSFNAPAILAANDNSCPRRHRSDAERRAIIRAWRMRCEMRARADLERRALLAANGDNRRLHEALQHAEAATAAMQAERDAAMAEIARLKAKPHHLGNEVRLDDVARLTGERDAARKSLASASEERDRLARAVGKGAELLEAMTDRALRAEIALNATTAQQSRELPPTPYRVKLAGVSFEVAA